MAARPNEISSFIRRRREPLAVGALLLVALALRVYQVDWDQGHLYHPDERYILMTTASLSLSWPLSLPQLLSPQSSLDPHGFAYGSFSFYLLRLVAAILVGLSHVGAPFQSLGMFNDLGNLRLIGRPISALFDTGTVLIVYQLGKRLYGRRVAFLGAAFVAFSVIDIQLSHFYATDTIMTSLALAAILSSVVYLREGRTGAAVWAGVFTGLALGTKVSSAPVLAPVGLAFLLRLFVADPIADGMRWKFPSAYEVGRFLRVLATSIAVGILVFVIVEPYAIIDFGSFVAGVSDQENMVRGIADVPYTRQFIGRPAYLYFVQNLVLFGVGLPLGLAMIAGWIYVVARAVRRARAGDLVLLAYVLPYFAITGDFYAKFMRYLLPITPLLALFAAVGLIHVLDGFRRWKGAKTFLRDGSGDQRDGLVDDIPPELLDEPFAADIEDLGRLDHGSTPMAFDGKRRAGEVEENEAPEMTRSIALTAEASRFAIRKGLSFELFESQPAVDSRLVVGASARGTGPIQDRLVEKRTENGGPPGWIERRSRLASFATGPWPTRCAGALIALVLGCSVFYSLAFDHMYTSLTTPVEGSMWLYQHAVPGSTIATEHWEEGMPVPILTASGVESADSFHYHNVTMPMYDDDTEAKLNTLVTNLESADYVVFFSNRLYNTVPRLPQRYPMSRRYYEQLFGEKLGFKLVAAFDRYPNLLGVAFVDDTLNDPGLITPPLLQEQRPAPITINLGHADESFSVYDHQKVLIFQKVEHLTPDQLRALIGPAPSRPPVVVDGRVPEYKSLVFTQSQEAAVQAGGTFRDIFDRNDLLNQVPLLVWIVLIGVIGAAGVPLAFLVFRFLPDRGYLVARALGVLILVWLNWIIVSTGVVEATRPTALGILCIYVLLGLIAGYLQRAELWEFLRSRRRLLGIEEGLFWLAFLFDVYIRSLDPDLWHPTLGGEKPMDLAYFTAAARSAIYPPYDPWFSGGYLNYYYFGQIIVGTLTKISGVLPTTSYNIVVPLLFALTVGGAFTVGLALLHRGDGPPNRSSILGGLLAGLMVCVLGNLGGFAQLVQQVAAADPSSVGALGLGWLSQVAGGAFAILTGGRPFIINQDWYWSSTRMLALLGLSGSGSINEFPYFTFLFADLHAHLIALPFTLLVIALCVNIVKSGGRLAHLPETRFADSTVGFLVSPAFTADPAVPSNYELESGLGLERHRSVATVAAVVAAGLCIGALYPINTWDYPTYLGLMALSMVIPWYLSRPRTLPSLVTVVVRLAIIVLLSRFMYQPFYANFQSFYSGVHLNDEESAVSWFFMINGLFLVVMISFFLVQGWTLYRRTAIVRSSRLYLAKWDLFPRVIELQRLLVKHWDGREVAALYGFCWLVLIFAGSIALGRPLAGVLVVLLVVAVAMGLRRDWAPEDCLLIFLFATGLALAIGVEQVTIDGDVGRMNTVFKFFLQIWVLWGVASAVAIVRTRERLHELKAGWTRWAWIGVVATFIAMAGVFPVIGTIARVSNRFNVDIPPTLDGTAYMNGAVYVDDGHPLQLKSDQEAIVWLQDHVDGTPTILEGNRPVYRWGSRFSIYTGLPTVIGWDVHQSQQRAGYADVVQQRLRDVQQMYDDPSPDVTDALLRSYHVTYVIEGELEQAFYPAARAKFDSMVGKYLSVVYDRDGVKIYQVNGS